MSQKELLHKINKVDLAQKDKLIEELVNQLEALRNAINQEDFIIQCIEGQKSFDLIKKVKELKNQE